MPGKTTWEKRSPRPKHIETSFVPFSVIKMWEINGEGGCFHLLS